MRDRLSELVSSRGPDEPGDTVVNIENDSEGPYMQDFFGDVEQIQGSIEEIQKNVEEVKQKHNKILSSAQTDDKLNEDLENLMGKIKTTANKVRRKLKQIQGQIEEEAASANQSADFRIKKTQHSTLSRTFIKVMNEYNQEQNTYRDRCKQRIERQLGIIGKAVPDDEIEEMIEKGKKEGNGSVQLFTGINMDAQQTKEIEARHNDILQLEKSIKELHDLFMDMCTLVQEQGEMVDRIENNVFSTCDYVEKAVEHTKKAVEYQSKARRKKICLIAVLIAVIIIVILAIVIPIVQKSNSSSSSDGE